jgi:hypothetical protein
MLFMYKLNERHRILSTASTQAIAVDTISDITCLTLEIIISKGFAKRE